MPLTGWLMSSASNYPVSWFGLVQLPDLVAPDPALKKLLHEVHETLSKILIALAGLHVAGALKHQFLDRDGLMFRMLPWRPR
jgi:cytochrome b561